MNNIKLFESKQIRTFWNESDQKWYFVVADVVQVLTHAVVGAPANNKVYIICEHFLSRLNNKLYLAHLIANIKETVGTPTVAAIIS